MFFSFFLFSLDVPPPTLPPLFFPPSFRSRLSQDQKQESSSYFELRQTIWTPSDSSQTAAQRDIPCARREVVTPQCPPTPPDKLLTPPPLTPLPRAKSRRRLMTRLTRPSLECGVEREGGEERGKGRGRRREREGKWGGKGNKRGRGSERGRRRKGRSDPLSLPSHSCLAYVKAFEWFIAVDKSVERN